jgi:hypothetical protein
MATYEYHPEHYTQVGINAGQRKINFALTEADRKLVAVLEALKNAIIEPPGQSQRNVADIQAAIEAAITAINKVAEITPPGCDPS